MDGRHRRALKFYPAETETPGNGKKNRRLVIQVFVARSGAPERQEVPAICKQGAVNVKLPGCFFAAISDPF